MSVIRYVKAAINSRHIKHWLQGRRWYRVLHIMYTRWRAIHRGLPHWEMISGNRVPSWQDNASGSDGYDKRVLIATGTGGHLPSMTLESLLGIALAERDAAVDFLLCDGVLPACMMCEINWYGDVAAFTQEGPRDRCDQCYTPSAMMLGKASLRHLTFSSQIGEQERSRAQYLAATIDRDQIGGFAIDGVSVGEHALAGALRFYARGELDGSEVAENLLRRYLEAALLTFFAAQNLLASGRYRVVVLNHGIYVPQGVIAETARKLGIRVVTWHSAYRRQCFIFSHNETYHHSLMTEPPSEWEGMNWGMSQKQQIESYLKSRWEGKGDWIRFHHSPRFSTEAIEHEVGVDFSRPTIGLLTNVIWDAQLHYPANAFPNMLDWLKKTIAYFKNRPDLQLLIRVHPAELTGTLPSHQPAVDEIRKAFPVLPNNVFVIPPDSRLSTYAAMSKCNAVVIYGTKMGVELSATGLPVIVAGEAWIRGKRVTMDATCEDDYFRLLDALPLSDRLDESARERAMQYAYHFFFRRMVPLNCVREQRGWPYFGVSIRDLTDLHPGKDAGLDIICLGILEGTSFVFPAERMTQ